MSRLTTAWESLGTIHLQLGNYSWGRNIFLLPGVDPSAATAEKLAQAYEKAGDKMRASKIYAIAYTSTRIGGDPNCGATATTYR